MGTLDISVLGGGGGGGGGGGIGFCYISIVLCWVRVSLRVSCFILGRFVLCLVYVFFFMVGRFFFLFWCF